MHSKASSIKGPAYLKSANDLISSTYSDTPSRNVTLPINLSLILSKVENLTVSQSACQKKWNILAEINAQYGSDGQFKAAHIWINASQTYDVRRFTTAKVIGHLTHVAGYRGPREKGAFTVVTNFELGGKKSFNDKKAEQFASQLLMPKKLMKRKVASILESMKKNPQKPELKGVIILLAESFGVSRTIMKKRLKELGYLRW